MSTSTTGTQINECSINDNFQITGTTANELSTNGNQLTCWGYWTDYWYPNVIQTSYPVYVQERSLDKGKQAFEIIKVLKDKKMVQLKKVSDFIDLMDALIKIL